MLGLSREAADSKEYYVSYSVGLVRDHFSDTLLAIAGTAVGVLAFVRAWMSPANAYDFAGKRPKNTWLALTGGSAAVSLFSVLLR